MDDKKRKSIRKRGTSKTMMAKMEEVVAAGWCCYSDVQTRTVWAETPSGFMFMLG